MDHILEPQQFSKKMIAQIFDVAEDMERVVMKGGDTSLQTKILGSVFYTISTRTRLSFEAAMLRLGGKVLSTEHPESFSSTSGGSNLEDTIRMIDRHTDIIVLRHPEQGSAEKAAAISRVPIINAGGGGQHPTQALLDVYTISRVKGGIDGISAIVMGNLADSRTGRSLCYLLAKYSRVKLRLVSPEALAMGVDILDYLTEHDVEYTQIFRPGPELDSALQDADVIYQTDLPTDLDYVTEDIKRESFIINERMLGKMRKHAIIMHPFPRIDGISPEVDLDPRAHYFQQINNGLFVRMALLSLILSPEQHDL